MKKNLLVLTGLLIVFTMVLSACAPAATEAPSAPHRRTGSACTNRSPCCPGYENAGRGLFMVDHRW